MHLAKVICIVVFMCVLFICIARLPPCPALQSVFAVASSAEKIIEEGNIIERECGLDPSLSTANGTST